MDDRASADFPEFLDEATAVWDRIAEWWDDQIGGGNAVQDLLEPITERLLELREDSQVLDIAVEPVVSPGAGPVWEPVPFGLPGMVLPRLATLAWLWPSTAPG